MLISSGNNAKRFTFNQRYTGSIGFKSGEIVRVLSLLIFFI
jgi:hypothetical protein